MFESLSRETLADRVARELLDYIEAHDLKPGARLPSMQKLAQEFEVSRPVIREALRSLAGTSVIEVVNGVGAIVQPLSAQPLGVFFQRAIQIDRDSVRELIEVRQGLEVQSAHLAAERRSDAELEQMTEIVRAMHDAIEDPDRYIDLDVAFHITMAGATQNTMLYHLISSMRRTLRASMDLVRTRQQAPLREHVQQTHEALLDAITRRDGPSAEQAMLAHFAEALLAVDEGTPSPPEQASSPGMHLRDRRDSPSI